MSKAKLTFLRLGLVTGIDLCAWKHGGQTETPAVPNRPNIIVILADDMHRFQPGSVFQF